jgi:hypothetical protein
VSLRVGREVAEPFVFGAGDEDGERFVDRHSVTERVIVELVGVQPPPVEKYF